MIRFADTACKSVGILEYPPRNKDLQQNTYIREICLSTHGLQSVQTDRNIYLRRSPKRYFHTNARIFASLVHTNRPDSRQYSRKPYLLQSTLLSSNRGRRAK